MNKLRNTTQHLLPVEKPTPLKGEYDIYPTHEVGAGKIFADYASLARAIAGEKRVIIDGYNGVFFDLIRRELNIELEKLGKKVLWWDTRAALKSESDIDGMITPFLGGDDPIFGLRTTRSLSDFYDTDKLARIQPDPQADLNILIGVGAALAGWEGTLLYIDIPKNEIQFRARSGSFTNLGATKPAQPKKMYKRFYFVEWVVLSRHKKALLPQIDIIIDAQREHEITWMQGSELRKGLDMLAHNAFRVRPWFEPGAWGGQWIKEHIHALAQDVPNYAWSFELIVPENGILFGSSGRMLEVSFDTIMFQAGEEVVGEACYAQYADEFPIRMDYLDNFDGGNLSIQCHPQVEYIRKNFGEVLTQEETYYMLDTKDNGVVYLGFQEDIIPSEFEQALTESVETGCELDYNRYVQSISAKKHDLFLIPPGTLHSAGRNNLVLEISTTPYIFTFKMYDWLALDLDGKPRPLNIRRAMENLCFDRKGKKVAEELVSKPTLMTSGSGWELWHLPTHRNHSYDVHRYHLTSSAEVTTDGKCHVLNLVEGKRAEIITAAGHKYTLSYAETLVVPAAAQGYKIVSPDGEAIQIVKAFMK